MSTPSADHTAVAPRRPLRAAASLLLLLEALLLVGTGAFVAFSAPLRTGGMPGVAAGLGLMLTIFAALLVAAAISVHRYGRFGVSYGITWQLFQALISGAMFKSAMVLPGVIALGLAVTLFVILMHKDVRPTVQRYEG